MEKTIKILFLMVGILILIVGIQSIFLFKVYTKEKPELKESTIDAIKPAPWQQNQPVPQLKNKVLTPAPSPKQNTNPLDSFGFFDDTDDWDPFKEMQRMRQRMDKMFQHGLNRFNSSPQFKSFFDSDLGFSPNLDIQETDNDYLVHLDLPGMDKPSIDVKLEDLILTISGIRDEKKEDKKDDKFFRQERSYGQFSRSVTLPGPVDPSGLKAEYKNGVLSVIIPKAEKTSSSKTIQIS